jgi:hypothetical protein
MFMFVRRALLGALLAICSMWPAAASAQKYPDKVVRYIVTDQPAADQAGKAARAGRNEPQTARASSGISDRLECGGPEIRI